MKTVILITIFMVGCASTPPHHACNPSTTNCDRTDRVMFKDTGRIR
jgi:hypothetical protein